PQHHTARTKLRHVLYERRAGILRGVLVALAPVFHDGRVAGDVIPELIRATSEKEVLLNAELCKYLDDLYRRSSIRMRFSSSTRTSRLDRPARVWSTSTPSSLP